MNFLIENELEAEKSDILYICMLLCAAYVNLQCTLEQLKYRCLSPSRLSDIDPMA